MADDLTKIMTCSYCGTRSILHLGETRSGAHELKCTACNAPLHFMKPIKQTKPKPAPRVNYDVAKTPSRKRYEKKKKKSKGVKFGSILREIFDELEDIFD